MKAQIAAKYLQFLNKKNANKNSGFTLIELLVVIIIIGILSAIALPSFLNQAAKARGAEAKSNVGSMNRAQQAYFLEQQTFSDTVEKLGLSLPVTSDNFSYGVTGASATSVTNQGTSRKPDIKSYGGRTQYDATTSTAQGTTTTILCEAASPGTGAVAPTTTAIATGCGSNIVVK